MRVALAQLNPTVGDFAGNVERIARAYEAGRAAGADLVAAPELAVCGYPPKDLLEKPEFAERSREAVEALAARTRGGPALVVGFVDRNESSQGNPLHNAAACCEDGRIRSIHRKSLLPTYDVFDEGRYFEPAREVQCARIRGQPVAVTICEDLWLEDFYWQGRRYGRDPLEPLLGDGPSFVLNIAASPWNRGKTAVRHTLVRRNAKKCGLPVLFVNQVGGQDELVFDGTSLAIDGEGALIARGAAFAEDLVLVDLASGHGEIRPEPAGGETERVLLALELGLRDYMRKTGAFERVVVGLSGGIDSSLVAAIAARALGPDRVLGVRMPSRYSSAHSLEDAAALAHNLGIELLTLPIEGPYAALLEVLAPVFAGRPFDVAEENLQARLRGMLLMAISNKLGHLVLSTGNKSELAVGYCTLYGDLSGGLALISDVPKTLVYELARLLNRERELIPARCFTKAPSAELREGQTDQDTLPPYELLDRVLEAYIEQGQAPAAIAAATGIERATVERIVQLVDRAEYKRRQAPPGIRVTRKAFGFGRRMPIAHRYRP
ncbi:MAG: NAD+ synthase [Planctomycetota bacterium]|nr:MAG: NAD+ synthase [Planctomycetota bacterium]